MSALIDEQEAVLRLQDDFAVLRFGGGMLLLFEQAEQGVEARHRR